MQPQKIPLSDHVDLLTWQNAKFKTARLTVALFLPLKAETAASYAILPGILTHATAAYPDRIALCRHLSRLYGASVSGSVLRVGEHQVLSLTVSCLENRFALEREDVVGVCTDLLLSMLFSPCLSADGCFDADIFKEEKRCLLERIAAEINDKRYYARKRADELLANGEPYGIPINGTVEQVDALTREAVTAAWKTVLETAKIQWFFTAEENAHTVAEKLRTAFAKLPRRVCYGRTETAFTPLKAPRRASERMAVNQAKLVMSFRIAAHEPDTDSVMTGRLLSAVFGGTPHSLLFRVVREKMSLCYYCLSSFDYRKGVLTVESGVNADMVERAERAILDQLEVVRRGEFSEEDLQAALRSVINRLQESENLQSSTVAWYLPQSLNPSFMTSDEAIERLKRVDKAAICRCAETVSLHSVFTILPEEG